MAIKMLVFDYRDSEKEFFGTQELENFEITFYNESLNEDIIEELPREILQNTCVISVFVNSDVNEKVINAFKNLRIISTRSTSVEHINLKAAEDKNISVINVEGYGAVPVAQYTFGLLIALVRHICAACHSVSYEDNIFGLFLKRYKIYTVVCILTMKNSTLSCGKRNDRVALEWYNRRNDQQKT